MGLLSDLIGAVGAVSASLPDPRKGKLRDDAYRMDDSVLSAFSLFFIGSPSFLAYQRRLEEGQGRSNCQTLFGIARIPIDAWIPPAVISHPWPNQRFDVKHPRQESSALAAHARICAGGAQ